MREIRRTKIDELREQQALVPEDKAAWNKFQAEIDAAERDEKRQGQIAQKNANEAARQAQAAAQKKLIDTHTSIADPNGLVGLGAEAEADLKKFARSLKAVTDKNKDNLSLVAHVCDHVPSNQHALLIGAVLQSLFNEGVPVVGMGPDRSARSIQDVVKLIVDQQTGAVAMEARRKGWNLNFKGDKDAKQQLTP